MDLRDITLHTIGAIAVGMLLAWQFSPGEPGGWAIVLLNAAIWHVREALQRVEKKQPYSHTWTGGQVLAEWVTPSIACPLTWLVLA